MNSLRPALKRLASLEMTIVSLSLLMLVVFFGTIAQAKLGTFAAQQIYFNRFFVWGEVGGFRFPVMPGGLLVGAVWLVNLTAALFVRYRPYKRSIGILISHVGLMILILGQFLTQRLARESQMPIEIGQTLHYSEDTRKAELVFVRSIDEETDEVIAVPARLLDKGGTIAAPQVPFQINVKKFYRNAELGMTAPGETAMADQGIGARIAVKEMPELMDDESVNNATAVIEIIARGAPAPAGEASDGGRAVPSMNPEEGDTPRTRRSLGTWLASLALGSKQTLVAGGHEYVIAMRPKRIYYPFSVTLKEFNHDRYPGTDIPKNFSSLVRIVHPAAKEERDTLIYMNNPLRYDGKTFYQSSFGKNDTLSVFQVVENPFWLTPYISCMLVTLGLGIQFMKHLLEFLRKRQ